MPTLAEISEAARDLLEREGPAALSMRRVAGLLGIQAPSLYEHVAGKQGLEDELVSRGRAEWRDFAGRALAGRRDGLAAIGEAYRAFALAHPHLYRLMSERPVPEPLAVDVMGGDVPAGHALSAFLHGMAITELNGGSPAGADLDAAWQSGLAAFWRLAR